MHLPTNQTARGGKSSRRALKKGAFQHWQTVPVRGCGDLASFQDLRERIAEKGIVGVL
jgi:hypothetical protein